MVGADVSSLMEKSLGVDYIVANQLRGGMVAIGDAQVFVRVN